MRTVLAVLILAAVVLISVTAFGIFAATIAEKDHAAHVIIGEPLGSPLASAANGGANPAELTRRAETAFGCAPRVRRPRGAPQILRAPFTSIS